MPHGFSIDELWRHSAAVGAGAQAICRCENASKEVVDNAYTAGVLHDAGKLVLAASCQDDYTHICDYAAVNAVPEAEAERELIGCTHGEIGGYLLGIWGLPNDITEAVAYHHHPLELPGNTLSLLTAVHVADALAFSHASMEVDYPLPEIDTEYLQQVELADRVDDWEAACAESLEKGSK